jgi:signal transduction histidine kinase
VDKKLRILMLEDVASDAELIERELRKAELEFAAKRVETKDDFLAGLRDYAPDLILSDYSLPTFDGISALALAREFTPLTPFIIVTGSLSEETAVECIKAGAADYVIKENLVRIGPAVKGALEKKRAMEEKERAERALLKQTYELARSNKELEQFAYVASHDLQEPLRKIITFGDRLKDHSGSALDVTGQDYLHRMQHAALRMRQLVDALLKYATVTAEPEARENVDPGKTVREVLTDLEILTAQLKARVDVGKLPALHVNAMQLRQLFQNLIANALKFCEKGVAPAVRISGRDLGNGFAEISVEDNGVGFDEKYADRIFMPFQRVHGDEELEGTGIGLTICHRIVQRHSGQITAKSVPGRGTTFVFTLPTAD